MRLTVLFSLSISLTLSVSCGGEDEAFLTESDLACARLSACASLNVAAGGTRLSGYDACRFGGTFYFRALGVQTACVASAATCDTVLACAGANERTPCEFDFSTTTCDGDVVNGCVAGVLGSRDCAAEGLTCNGGQCVQMEACTESRCEGDRLFTCQGDSGLISVDTCEPGLCEIDSGFGTCQTSAETCERSFCDGDVANKCSGGRLTRERCMPGMCAEDDGARCLNARDCFSKCEGTTLLACTAGGSQEAIDCTQIGFGNCEESPIGARCIP